MCSHGVFDDYVKTGFYDATYINKWCHYDENAVTLIYMGIKNEAPKAVTAFRASFLRKFGCNDVFAWISTWENIFSTGENRKGIQLERMRVGFSKH